MSSFQLIIQGTKELRAKLTKAEAQIKKTYSGAGREAAAMLLREPGLKKYPPATAANQPPAPFYIRGRGTQYASGKNSYSSERLGTRWYTKAASDYGTEVGNTASYAPFVHGEEQAGAMADKGWRKLIDVANEKKAQIVVIYDKWIAKFLKGIGL